MYFANCGIVTWLCYVIWSVVAHKNLLDVYDIFALHLSGSELANYHHGLFLVSPSLEHLG